ncbi:4'-phosphopantetheinyl transferase superfamily protein [Streptomyces sp. NPDC087917]|uniref:4'-phosphopantetheinyl transferase family protein n=1 Tax=Streptomyces sp. NPDC087917 TaxID=3155060 RepID=UPI0034228650
MIGAVLRAPAVTADAFADAPEPSGAAPLFPAEAALVAGAVAARRAEFTGVRACARAALDRLGVAPAPLLPGPGGAPVWPDGIVGSLTHCRGYRGAAVARAGELRTIGCDAEPDEPLPRPGMLDMIALPVERARLRALRLRDPSICWDRLLFSAKESVYKAWYPLTGRWLDFEEAAVTLDPKTRTFRAELLVPGPEVDGRALTGFDGRWAAGRGLLLTAVAVPAAAVLPAG